MMLAAVGQLHVDLTVRIQALSLAEAECSDVVVVAAAGGDLNTLTKYLRQHPEHVRHLIVCCMYMYMNALVVTSTSK